MALKVQSSYAGGEIDPALQERTTLSKYKDGLSTARNVIISKTGSVMSRISRNQFIQTKLDNRKVKLFSPPVSSLLIEWGHLYVRIYDFGGTLLGDTAHAFTEADLPNIHFEASQGFLYVFCQGKEVYKYTYLAPGFLTNTDIFKIPAAPTAMASFTPAGTPAGYFVDYAVTYIQNGQESARFEFDNMSEKIPIAAGQSNSLETTLLPAASAAGVTEMRIYRRPTGNGVFGYIGSTSAFAVVGADFRGYFIDLGQGADYTNSPPIPITPNQASPLASHSKTGIVYQQRLLLTDSVNLEMIMASRPGFQNNFFQSFPIAADSALKFKSGTSGTANVLRMLDDNGLFVFTSVGIFQNTGPLDPTNLALVKRGKWIIDQTIPPLSIPGGVVFVDVTTNTVRNLVWSYNIQNYIAQEVSVFSNHLFLTRKITSWAFHEGNFPVLWVTFDDGTYASFTYEQDQEMRAWTRHDSITPVEQVCATGIADATFFVVRKGTTRYIEVTIPRHVPAADFVTDAEADKNPTIAFMDSIVSYRGIQNGKLIGTDVFTLDLNPGGAWDGPLILRCGTSGVFTQTLPATTPPTPFNVGTVLRVFDPSDGSTYDLTVTHWTSVNELIVQPSIAFPAALASGFNLYVALTYVAGLSHLEGEYPSVIVDGAVICSPNNDDQNYAQAQVNGGILLLPPGVTGAIIHVGRPITADIETLEIDTIEQAPTLLESKNIDKLYIKVRNSSSLYVDDKFPVDTNVKGMVALDQYDVDYSQDNPIIGNRYQALQTKRVEMTLPGDWKRQGKLAVRQVDPLNFEVLSIIPDVEVLERSR